MTATSVCFETYLLHLVFTNQSALMKDIYLRARASV